MSKPNPGNYYIINRVLSPTGDKLAITNDGQGKPMTVTPMGSSDSQKWTLVNYTDGNTQSVSPLGQLSVQAGPIGNAIGVCPQNNLVYWIRGGNGQPYTIHQGNGGPINWAVATATNGAQVNWGDNEGQYQTWILQPF